MRKKTMIFLVQVTYSNENYEYSLFYTLHRSSIRVVNNRLSIKDGSVEFIDGIDGVNIYVYSDYKVTVLDTVGRSHRVIIEANRHRFCAFKPLQFIREANSAYDYYYKKKLNKN